MVLGQWMLQAHERDKSKFLSISFKQEGYATYGDNNKGRILGRGSIGDKDILVIHDVLYVEGIKHNLLSISQLCDKGYQVMFKSNTCEICLPNTEEVMLVGKRVNNVYLLDISSPWSIGCLLSKQDESWLWHRRIAHIHMNNLNKLISKDLVIGLPKLKFEKDHICEACQKGKQVKSSFQIKNVVSSLKPLELLRMDLFGPSRTMNLGGNYYALVIVDDFSMFTWTLFLETKSDAFSAFKKLARRLQNTKNCNIGSIRSDHGGEFQNEKFSKFCEKMGILHNFSAPRTPQQNGVVERKNRSLEKLARTVLSESSLPKYFCADAVSTLCYVMNKVLIRPILKKTPYELFNGRKPNINPLRVFGCSCFVLNNGKENLEKFDEKENLGIFIGYSLTSHAYRIYNKRLMTVEESVHVAFDEVDHRNIQIPKTSAEEDEQSISLEKLEICAEKQPVDSQKQPIEILQ